jgi:adenylyltransferase/sulfurtransferase
VQIIHDTERAKARLNKAKSAKISVELLNPHVECIVFEEMFTVENAMRIAKGFDVLVDASDNVATRYLINDVGILLGLPIVSGSAVRTEGQLTVYGYTSADGIRGPCYRCIFPVPPPPEAVTNCADSGVLGPVVGVIGSLQAMEVCKVITGSGEVLSGKLIIYDAMSAKFRTVKLRTQSEQCIVCNRKDADLDKLPVSDYLEFCGHFTPSSLSSFDQQLFGHVSCSEFASVLKSNQPHILIDVREKVQFEICSLSNSINIPLSQLPSRISEIQTLSSSTPIYLICRRGIFSKSAANLLCTRFNLPKEIIFNISGGLESWKSTIDPKFPTY